MEPGQLCSGFPIGIRKIGLANWPTQTIFNSAGFNGSLSTHRHRYLLDPSGSKICSSPSSTFRLLEGTPLVLQERQEKKSKPPLFCGVAYVSGSPQMGGLEPGGFDLELNPWVLYQAVNPN